MPSDNPKGYTNPGLLWTPAQLRARLGHELSAWSRSELATRVAPSLELRLATSIPDDDLSIAAETIRSWRHA